MVDLAKTGVWVAALAVVLLCGCSNRQMYESIQYGQQQDCRIKPPSEYERCMERTSQSYDDYKRARDEVLAQPQEQPDRAKGSG